jgi:GNAT superfamily N-acetyltransferase
MSPADRIQRTPASDHPLAAMLRDAAFGAPPPPDMEIEVLPAIPGASAAVVAFGGHVVVAADVPADWVASCCPPGDLVAPIRPAFLAMLSERCGCTDFSTTLTFALPPVEGIPDPPLAPARDLASARVARSLRVRTEVRAYETDDRSGLLVIGRGLAGRWEFGVEVRPEARGQGLGRRLAQAARRLVPTGQPLFGQVVPGNVASVRMMIGAGFPPVCSEVLLW